MHWAFHCKSHSTRIEMSLVAHGLRRTGRGIVHYVRNARVACSGVRSLNNVLSRRRVTADWRAGGGRGAGSAHLARGAPGAERWRCAAHLPTACPARAAHRPRSSPRTRPENTRKTAHVLYANTCPCVKTSEMNRLVCILFFCKLFKDDTSRQNNL